MTKPKQPNFILIMSDQHRGDCLSLNGHPAVLTPNMDSIGGRGVNFSRAYSTCPSCIPARRCLMSGQSPAKNGMVGYKDDTEWSPAATLPGVLRDAGYHTAIVGRNMHLYPRRRRYGFDEQVITNEDYSRYLNLHQTGDPVTHMGHGVSPNGWSARPWHLDEKLHPTNWSVSEALRFLERRDPNCPFFLTASFIAPHPPLTPPAFYLDRYLRQELPAPFIGDWAEPPANGGRGLHIQSERVDLRGEALHSCRAGYYGLINHLDDQIFRLLSTNLLDAETRRNTYIIYTTDHGEMLGDHYLFRKCFPYEGSARIPMLINGPGIAAGRTCDRPVGLEDLMPTFLDLAGCKIPAGVDGQSLAPYLRGETAAPPREIIHGEHSPCYSKEQANHYLTDGKTKYIWLPQSGTEQLFDLEQDPGEIVNLASRAEAGDRLKLWRERLIERLTGRPEGFVDNGRLVAGRPYTQCLPWVNGTPSN